MLPTVGAILGFDVVQRGCPRVVAGKLSLANPVRWVHVSELADIAHLLRGGELVLTTGIALPDEPSLLANYVTDLARVGASGLMVELGRRYTGALPGAMVRTADDRGLPLVALAREVPFVQVTEAVHGHIINAQLEELRASEQLHQTFTELSVRGATPEEVVGEVARLLGHPAVLENVTHQAVAAAGGDLGELLGGWEDRSRRVASDERTGYDAGTGFLVSMVGARDEDWGRLVLVCGEPPTTRQTMLVERAATTLALGRLIERDQDSLLRQAHRTLISGILRHVYTDDELTARAQALGVPLARRRLVGVAVTSRHHAERPGLTHQSRLRMLADSLVSSARGTGVAALAASLDEQAVTALITLPPSAPPEPTLEQLSRALRQAAEGGLVVGVGSVVSSVRETRRSLLEARQIADVARNLSGERPYYRLVDLGVRGLLYLICDDTRVQTFVERQLGPLLAYDARQHDGLLPVLAAYLHMGSNKSAAAAAAHLSRPAFYDRLQRIERLLDVRLDDAEQRTTLHVALLALDATRSDHAAAGTAWTSGA